MARARFSAWSMRLEISCIAALLMIAAGSTRADDQPNGCEKKLEAQPAATDAPNAASVKFTWRVVDQESGQGIPGANVEIQILEQPVPGQAILDFEPLQVIKRSADANGNYEFALSQELLAKPDFMIRVKADCDGYVSSTQGLPFRLPGKSLDGRNLPASNKTILRLGEEVNGILVNPLGEPLKGVRVESHSIIAIQNRRSATSAGATTDDQGRFRLFVPKDSESMIAILPENFAFGKKHIGKNRGDIGEIRVDEGIRICGVLLDVDRRPVVGVPVNIAQIPSREVESVPFSRPFRRGELTDSEGKFSFNPLAPGEYHLTVDDRIQDPLKPAAKKVAPASAIFARKTIVLQKVSENAPIEIQAIPYIVIRAQFYNSENEKVKGESWSISGLIDGQSWSIRPTFHSSGSYELKVPHGLERTHLQVSPNQATAFKYRRGSGETVPGAPFMRNDLGTLSDDETLDVILYTAPTVNISALDDQGDPITQFGVKGEYAKPARSKAGDTVAPAPMVTLVRSTGGGFRTVQMLPDEDVTFTITASGYSSVEEKVNLKEGETKTLKVTLSKDK